MQWAVLHDGSYMDDCEPTSAAWSVCGGNVVAVAYGPVVTLWDVESFTVRMVLSKHDLLTDPITSLVSTKIVLSLI